MAAPGQASLPFTALAPSGSAQAVAIGPTQQGAGTAADTGGNTPNLFLLFTLAIMAIPALVTITLLATVLTRR